jgi:hypothetical protein
MAALEVAVCVVVILQVATPGFARKVPMKRK